MNGFIEVHTEDGEIVAINIKYLKMFSNYTVIPHNSLAMTVKETYEEIKRMIEIAENDKNT